MRKVGCLVIAVATLGSKVAGSSVENPNQFFASHVSSSYLQPLGADEAKNLEAMVLFGGCQAGALGLVETGAESAKRS